MGWRMLRSVREQIVYRTVKQVVILPRSVSPHHLAPCVCIVHKGVFITVLDLTETFVVIRDFRYCSCGRRLLARRSRSRYLRNRYTMLVSFGPPQNPPVYR